MYVGFFNLFPYFTYRKNFIKLYFSNSPPSIYSSPWVENYSFAQFVGQNRAFLVLCLSTLSFECHMPLTSTHSHLILDKK